jgi:hypothetical protein
MKYFTIVGIVAHIAVIIYLTLSFILGDINFINWAMKDRVVYISLTSAFSFCFIGIGSLFASS